jgi:hypothetical protein
MQHTVTLDSKCRVSLARVGGRPGQKLRLRTEGRSYILESPPQIENEDDWRPSITLKQLFRHKVDVLPPMDRMRKEKVRRVRL